MFEIFQIFHFLHMLRAVEVFDYLIHLAKLAMGLLYAETIIMKHDQHVILLTKWDNIIISFSYFFLPFLYCLLLR